MASSSHANHQSEPAKIEQIITEFFTKSLHIILESRSPCVSSRNYSGEQILSSPSSSTSSSSSIRPRDKWFNLALRECPAALENLDLWRQSNLEPMVVDVILVQRPVDLDPIQLSPRVGLVRNLSSNSKERFPSSWVSGLGEFPSEMKSEKVIERWVVKYEPRKSRESNSASKRSSGTSHSALYKKSIILLRSLYLTVRILPAYKLFRDLNSSGQLRTYSLAHRVSSFVEPFTRREEAEMQPFGFTPVDTSCGRLCLSVLYRPSLLDVSLEPLHPISPQFIPDYVGSPATEPLKRFPSLPITDFGSHGSLSPMPFARRHSWGYDLYRASTAPLVSPSPSPTYSDFRSSSSNPSSHRLPPMSSLRHPPENPHSNNASLASKKNTSFDEYRTSPFFSPSPSPSPPTYFPGNHLSRALLRSESDPVSIPTAKLGRSPLVPTSHVPPLSPSPRSSKPGSSSRTDNARALMILGDIQTGLTTQKMNSFGKDEVVNLSGAKISANSSPRISFSRSSGRLSFQDEFDEPEFACPFADFDDIVDPCCRPESFDGKGHLGEPLEPGGLLPVRKSQDAAVGDLVRMLRTAQPLRPDFSNSIKLSQISKPEIWNKNIQEPDVSTNPESVVVQNAASDLGITSPGLKTTAEALEELRRYREMKDLLLRQGGES